MQVRITIMYEEASVSAALRSFGTSSALDSAATGPADPSPTKEGCKTQFVKFVLFTGAATHYTAQTSSGLPDCPVFATSEIGGVIVTKIYTSSLDISDTIIDCKQGIVVPAPPMCRYVALSYVWGQGDDTRGKEDGESGKCLPRTIEDVIQLIRQLGYRHLWVDRYCIDQDDGQDKHIQISQMGDIYAMATLTVVAAAGSSPAHGLPGLFSRPRHPVRHVRLKDFCISILPMSAGQDIAESAWASRAWTFQEGFLSRRRLIFTDTQVSFVCNTSYCQETESSGLCLGPLEPWLKGWLPRHSEKSNFPDYYRRALSFLSNYTQRKLSRESDALNAISGALNTLAIHSTYHLWGVPFEHAAAWRQSRFALLWKHPGNMGPFRRRLGFPSWSPLGWHTVMLEENELEFGEPYAISTRGLAIRIDGNIRHLDTYSPHSALNYSLVSQYLQMDVQMADLTLALLPNSQFTRVFVALSNEINVVLDPHWDVVLPNPEIHIQGILLTQIGTLKNPDDLPGQRILRRVMLLQKHDDHYERVGIAYFPEGTPTTNPSDWKYKLYDSKMKWLGYGFRNDSDNAKWLSSLPAAALQIQDTWWQQHFKKTTILLG
ncbi:hypothetical protein OPT61_g9575 [Boeremia exigua]|uniref:Uncharacterized protein n=1 Tax=Boeremia exigua TaxID=749465 RepID=A0ACC2HTI3_9PLEO|nr:hypothetical protein OPT61_g9575 [Boeremia exigua]